MTLFRRRSLLLRPTNQPLDGQTNLLLDTCVRCLTTTKEWHDEIRDMHNKMVNQYPKLEQDDRPPVQAQNILILEYTINRHKIGKCSPYATNQVSTLREMFQIQPCFLSQNVAPGPLCGPYFNWKSNDSDCFCYFAGRVYGVDANRKSEQDKL